MNNRKNIIKNDSHRKLFISWSYGKKNYILFSMGLAIVTISYFLMASGSVSSFRSLVISPILLVFGYLVIIPIALLYKE